MSTLLQDVANLKSALSTLTSVVRRLGNRVSSGITNTTSGNYDDEIDTLTADVKTLDSSLTSLSSSVSTNDADIADHETRLIAVESGGGGSVSCNLILPWTNQTVADSTQTTDLIWQIAGQNNLSGNELQLESDVEFSVNTAGCYLVNLTVQISSGGAGKRFIRMFDDRGSGYNLYQDSAPIDPTLGGGVVMTITTSVDLDIGDTFKFGVLNDSGVDKSIIASRTRLTVIFLNSA
jgi:hypothetical protein